MFNFWRLAGLIDGLKQHLQPLCSQKNEMLIFGFHLTSDDWKGWSMDSNPICHPSPAKKMKCSFLGYVQLLMISQAGQWTQTPSTTPLQPKTWNACFWITFNFWWSARLVDGLEPHLPPLSSEKIEMFIFGLHSTPDDRPGWSMDLNPIYHLSPAKKMKCSFLDYIQLLMIGWAGRWNWALCATSLQPKKWNVHFWITFNFWWLVRLVDGLEPHLPPISSQENEMLIFGICSTSDDQPGWSMDSNPSATPLQPKTWNACFWITFNFWWSAGLVNGLKQHLQPLSSQKKWNAHFWITFNFWWSAGLVNGLKRHPPPLSSQKHEMLVFGLHSTSDDLPGWSMHSNPICHLSPAKKMKSSFLDYIQILKIGPAGQWTWTPSTTSLQPKNEMLIFGLCSTSDDWPGWSMDLSPVCHLSAAKKMKCSFLGCIQLLMIAGADQLTQTPSTTPRHPKKMKCPFLDYIQILMISQVGPWTRTAPATHLQPKKWNPHFWNTFNSWWSAGLVDGLEPHLPRLSSQKHEILIFGFHWTSDDWPGWSMDLNPIYHLSPAKKMKCSFLDYVQLLMIGRAGRWTWALCATSLQPKKWNAHFWVTFNFWWSARLVDELEPHLQPLSSQKKLNALFWITFNFWWLPGLINWLELHPPPLSSQKNEMSIFRLQSNSDDKPGWSMDSNPICHLSPAKKNEMLIFGICSTSDDQPGWSMDLNPICHLSPAKKMKCSFLDYIQLLMIGRAGRWTWTPSTTSLQPQKWNAHFWITFNFWWSAGLVNGLECHPPPLSSQKHEMLVFG